MLNVVSQCISNKSFHNVERLSVAVDTLMDGGLLANYDDFLPNDSVLRDPVKGSDIVWDTQFKESWRSAVKAFPDNTFLLLGDFCKRVSAKDSRVDLGFNVTLLDSDVVLMFAMSSYRS